MLNFLKDKLDLAFNEQWHHKIKTKYELLEENGKIGINFFKNDESMNWVLIHSEPLTTLKNKKSANEYLSKALSSYLRLHNVWRKN